MQIDSPDGGVKIPSRKKFSREVERLEQFADSILGDGELDFALLVAMRGPKDGDGPLDHACPVCGPERSTKATREAPKLRTWRPERDTITYFCARCETKGTARASDPPRSHPLPLQIPPAVRPRSSTSGDNDFYAAQLWEEAAADLAARARAYFERRGISLDDVPAGALRYHKTCPWRGTGSPAFLRATATRSRASRAAFGGELSTA